MDSSERKRKKFSDAEKIALELFKLTSPRARQLSQRKIRLEEGNLQFEDSKFGDMLKGNECCWTNHGNPIYCPETKFQFETCLPDREYLTQLANCET